MDISIERKPSPIMMLTPPLQVPLYYGHFHIDWYLYTTETSTLSTLQNYEHFCIIIGYLQTTETLWSLYGYLFNTDNAFNIMDT